MPRLGHSGRRVPGAPRARAAVVMKRKAQRAFDAHLTARRAGIDTNRLGRDARLGSRGPVRCLALSCPVGSIRPQGGGDEVGNNASRARSRAVDVQRGDHHGGRDRDRWRGIRGGPRGPGGRGARSTRRAVLLRPGPQGLRGHGHREPVEGLVHGGGRGAVRRLRADHRQHQREHAAVPRHGWVHVHRPANPGHDVHGGRRPHRHGLHGDRDEHRSRLPAHHYLHHRPRPRHGAHAHPVFRAARLQRGRAAPVCPA
jgi:hypothetical protein